MKAFNRRLEIKMWVKHGRVNSLYRIWTQKRQGQQRAGRPWELEPGGPVKDVCRLAVLSSVPVSRNSPHSGNLPPPRQADLERRNAEGTRHSQGW